MRFASLDMCLMKVRCKLDHVVRWWDENVEVGQTVFLVGHPSELVGILVVGKAVYLCSENVNFNIDDWRIFKKHRPSTIIQHASIPRFSNTNEL